MGKILEARKVLDLMRFIFYHHYCEILSVRGSNPPLSAIFAFLDISHPRAVKAYVRGRLRYKAISEILIVTEYCA